MQCGYGRVKTLTDILLCLDPQKDVSTLRHSIMVGVPAVWKSIRKGIFAKVYSRRNLITKAVIYTYVPVLAQLASSFVFVRSESCYCVLHADLISKVLCKLSWRSMYLMVDGYWHCYYCNEIDCSSSLYSFPAAVAGAILIFYAEPYSEFNGCPPISSTSFHFEIATSLPLAASGVNHTISCEGDSLDYIWLSNLIAVL